MKLSTPHINKNDITSINNVMKSGWISTSSKIVNDFEKKLSIFCETKYSLALNSGTSAIHMGLKILGVDKNCEVIVPSLTSNRTFSKLKNALTIVFIPSTLCHVRQPLELEHVSRRK